MLYKFFAMLESYLAIPKSRLAKFTKNRGAFRTFMVHLLWSFCEKIEMFHTAVKYSSQVCPLNYRLIIAVILKPVNLSNLRHVLV